MYKISMIICLTALTIAAKSQNEESISIGKKITLFSNTLNENRKIWIYNPALTAAIDGEDKCYPVVYVLDGEAHFLSIVGMIQQLSQANGNTILPEMMVVGIENTNRLRDLIPSKVAGGKNTSLNPFVNFLKTELMPFVEKNYHAAPYKILVGHSLGGLTAIDILTNSPNLFNAYIAIDPSMWYDHQTFLNNSIAEIPNKDLQGTRLFIGTANTMPKGMTLSGLLKDHSDETQHIRSIFKLDKFLKGHLSTGLKYSSKYYKEESHMSVPLISEYDGFRFIFDYYLMDIAEKELTDSSSLIATRYKQHYDRISNELGYKNAPPEAFVNYLGYDAMLKKNYHRAAVLLKLNIENYPQSSKVYDAYADYLASQKDSVDAILNYKKALAIRNDSIIQNKLAAFSNPRKFTLSSNELEKYAGVYMLETYKVEVNLEIMQGRLLAKVRGQADDELIAVAKDIFAVKDKPGYTITFQMSDKRATAFTSVQPNGVFKAIFK